jgi:Mg2+-importing ATPase
MSNLQDIKQFWSQPIGKLIKQLETGPTGLSSSEAKRRLARYGPNRLQPSKKTDALILLLSLFKSPLILILLGAVILSFFLTEPVNALIIVAIVLLSSVLGFWQEKRAADAVKSLLAIVRIESRVVRDGVETDVPAEEIVPGDVCVLSAGDIIPGDAMILVCLSGEQTRKPSLQRTLGLNARCQRD